MNSRCILAISGGAFAMLTSTACACFGCGDDAGNQATAMSAPSGTTVYTVGIDGMG